MIWNSSLIKATAGISTALNDIHSMGNSAGAFDKSKRGDGEDNREGRSSTMSGRWARSLNSGNRLEMNRAGDKPANRLNSGCWLRDHGWFAFR